MALILPLCRTGDCGRIAAISRATAKSPLPTTSKGHGTVWHISRQIERMKMRVHLRELCRATRWKIFFIFGFFSVASLCYWWRSSQWHSST